MFALSKNRIILNSKLTKTYEKESALLLFVLLAQYVWMNKLRSLGSLSHISLALGILKRYKKNANGVPISEASATSNTVANRMRAGHNYACIKTPCTHFTALQDAARKPPSRYQRDNYNLPKRVVALQTHQYLKSDIRTQLTLRSHLTTQEHKEGVWRDSSDKRGLWYNVHSCYSRRCIEPSGTGLRDSQAVEHISPIILAI